MTMEDLLRKKRKSKKWLAWFLAILIIVLGGFIYWKYYFVLGVGVKSGELNYIVYKGIVFKTYEGKLIQSGFRADKPGGLQSNQFEFSVTDKDIAERLMLESGKHVQLRYKEYNGRLPWRGFTRYVVDSIISIEDTTPAENEEDDLAPYILDTM